MPDSALMTTQQFLAAFPEDNIRRELFDGEVIVSPSPMIRHQEISFRLTGLFYVYLSSHSAGRAFAAPCDVVLSDGNVVQPDLVFVGNDQLDIVTDKNIEGIPRLLVEVVSQHRMDRLRKKELYERHGVGEYWIVDPDGDRVEAYRLDGGRYGKPELFEVGDTLASPALPDLRVDVAELFR